jgi:hypothetical protein
MAPGALWPLPISCVVGDAASVMSSPATSPAQYPAQRRLCDGESGAEPQCREAVPYPPLSDMGDLQRREFHEALLEAHSFEDLEDVPLVVEVRDGGPV